MSKALYALKTKQDWQRQELLINIQKLDREILALENQIQTLKQPLSQQPRQSHIINPEIEMNRLNFMMITQEKIEQLQTQIKDLTDHQQTLSSKLERIQIELKMLDKYLQRKKEEENQKEQKRQEHCLDEWALLNKEIA